MRRGSVRPLLPLLGAAVAALPALGAFPAAARAAAGPPAGYVALDAYAAQAGASVRYNPDTQQSFVVWSGHVWVAYPIATANLPGETPANAVLVGGRLFLPQTLLQADMPPAPPAAGSGAAGAPAAPAAPPPTVARVIAVLRGALGDPYVWGGTTPSGFDCSGLMQWAFAQVGVALPRTSFAQFETGTAAAQPAPGDLVFFQTYAPGASHVGMFIGNGQFIDVGETVVKVDDFTAPYWAQRYLGARDVLPA